MLNYENSPPGANVLLTHLTKFAIEPAFELLPERMGSKPARTLLLAIALQESGANARRQAGGGPARGYWQFEHSGGVAGVLKHTATAYYAASTCRALDYPVTSVAVYQAIEHNDILAAALARLLLWSLPQPLAVNQDAAWEQYIAAWRPGEPNEYRWGTSWRNAVDFVQRQVA